MRSVAERRTFGKGVFRFPTQLIDCESVILASASV